MKIYKLEVFRNGESQNYVRLPFVPFGAFLGFKKDEEGRLKARFDIRIEEGRAPENVELGLNEEFAWSSEKKDAYRIKLVYVDAEKEDIFTLYNGVEVPRLGFGTWLVENSVAPEVVKTAIDAGYIHLDSAQAYGNESGIQIAIKNSLFKREDLFITSKVHADHKSYDAAKKSIEESLERLGTDHIDLMLIHCPQPWPKYSLTGGYRYEKENLEVWRAMCEAYKEGKLRSIGVSNFNIDDLKNIIENSDVKPMVNQIPVHLGNVWKELIDYCREQNIMVEAYSPLAHARLFSEEVKNNVYLAVNEDIKTDPALKRFDDSLNAVQTYLSYASAYSDIILPKASSIGHMLDNMKYLITLDKTVLAKMEERFDNTVKKL